MTAPTTHRRLGLSVLLGSSGSAQIVAVGELDIETAPTLADALTDTAAGARRVVVDLTAVTFLDPTALATVCAAVSALRGQVAVIPPAGGAGRRFLQVLRLDQQPLAA